MHDNSNIRLTMVQLPALNTPQFRWVKSRLPHEAQPVPPIYQPEVAAAAIMWAAYHDRREIAVGLPSVLTIWGNKFFPGLGDRYLARTGYGAQQTNEPRAPDRPHNLWQPVPGDHGAHGVFDERARAGSWQLWANTHLRELAAVGLGLAGVALLFVRWRL
jgi:hypothetical protein